MDIHDILSKLYPEGSTGGQCFDFLHKLATFAPVGDTLPEKLKAIQNFGLTMALFNGNFRLGDIVLTNESISTGHGFMVNKTIGPNLQVSESNYHLDGKIHHTRLIAANSPHILGVIRPTVFTFPFPAVEYPIQITCKILMNNQPPWNQSLLRRMAELQDWFYQNSGQKIELIVDYKDVNVTGWPLVASGGSIGGALVDIIEENWFNQNILPLSQGANVTFFVIRKQDWQGHVYNQNGVSEIGYCYEPHYPIKSFIIADENDDYPPVIAGLWGLSKIAAHELSHGLYGIAQGGNLPPQSDLTHNHFFGINGSPQNFADIFKDFDYTALNAKINS